MHFSALYAFLTGPRGHTDKKGNLKAVKAAAVALGIKKPPFKIIHIAGTNGKGTTATLIADALQAAGFKTGLYTSPHIHCVTERIKINNQNITKSDFVKYINLALNSEPIPLKFFELATLGAYKYFADNHIDYAVMECGIGGKLDSTNIAKPVLSIITSIGLDHTALLGNTIARIAAQKGGIIKSGVPCITGTLCRAAAKVIKNICKAKKSPLLKPQKNIKIKVVDYKKAQTILTLNGFDFTLNLLGKSQVQNACIVLSAAQVLGVDIKYFFKACKQIQMPCRFEVSQIGGKLIIKDGAHNPPAVAEFIANYKHSSYYAKNNTLVLCVSMGKDYKAMAVALQKYFDNIIITQGNSKISLPAQVLAAAFNKPVCIAKNPANIDIKTLSGNIIALGSFYLFKKLPF